MPSAWIEHVKATYKGGKAGMSYKEAMIKAKATWAKKKAGGKTEDKPMKKAKKAKKKKDRADDEEEEHDEKVESEPKRKRRLKKKASECGC